MARPNPSDTQTQVPEASERVESLLAEMTLPEKLAQLGCVWSTQLAQDAPHDSSSGLSEARARELMPDGTGQVTRIAASSGLRPAGVARFANEIQHWLVENTRLGIPAIVHEESVAGFCARDAVAFPQAIGLAASFDTDLLQRIGDHIRAEMLAVGARQALAPVLDIARDPRWGRVEETYGEDPVLTGMLGTAYVRGLQNTGPEGLAAGVLATAKHFCGYAASDGGLNHGPVHLGSRELREVHAEPFAAVIRDADLASIMNSYASVDGLPPAGSEALLGELLRDELGFGGTVVADYFAVDLLRTHHRVAPTKGVAAAKAITAGLDVELPQLDCFSTEHLGRLVDAGVVPIEVIDRSVRRVLQQKEDLGLFEEPFVDEQAAPACFGTDLGRELALRAALESLVLVDNDGVLPIDAAGLGTVAVIGPAADDPRLLEGDYHYPAHLEIVYDDSSGVDLLPAAGGAFAPGPYYPPIVTPLAGLRTALGDGVEVAHERGCGITAEAGDETSIAAALDVARHADVAVVCVGGRSGLTPDATVGEFRDASDLALTGNQLELLRVVAGTGTPTIAVVCSGRVHSLVEVQEAAGATVVAWVPGIEGGTALARILLGEVAPSGRLPISLPHDVGQVPVHHAPRAGGGRSMFWGDYTDAPSAPLHPFGFGLSTTGFEYSDLQVTPGSTTEVTMVAVTVTNTGPITGTEVVQLYARDEVASVARPERQLVGFCRVPLKSGQSRTATFALHPSRLAFYDEDFRFVCEPGAFDLGIGGWAGAPRLTATVDLGGDVHQYRQRDVVATAVSVSVPPVI
ncbi:MAG: glycoside hydrolase family 3 N-terminal domain-containing protein [Microthrixaceae bacterium]